MDYANLSIIGTSHIAKESIKEIEQFISSRKPDLVALELDRARFHALTTKKKQSTNIFSAMSVGLNGFLFLIFGQWAQRLLGRMVGVRPGSEMLAAVKLARKEGILIVLIDQDIEITLKRFSKALSFKEKMRIFWDLTFGTIFHKDDLRKYGISNIDLNRVPDDATIRKMMGVVRERYPGIYRVLVEERNVVMAKNLAKLMEHNPDKRILAIVGAGHESELLELVRLFRQDTGISFEVSS